MIRKYLCCTLFLLAGVLNNNAAAAQGTVTKFVERMPEFKGNIAEFLSNNLRYPDSAREHGIEGRAVVEFMVEPTGLVDQIHIKQSSGNELLDEEAMRVIRLMQLTPLWTPGVLDGKRVQVSYTIPITFKLDEPSVPDEGSSGSATDIARLAQDLMRREIDGQEHYFVFWSPLEYWSTAFRLSGLSPEAFNQSLEKELAPYSIFWASQYRMGSLGRLISDDSVAVYRSFVLNSGGKAMYPLGPAELSPTLKELLEQLKPVFGNMLGDFGKGVQFLVFKNTDAQGKRLLDPKAKGSFSIDFFGKHFSYTTPLAAMIPPEALPAG